MPELPEVETIRLGLSRKIIGLKIKEIEVLAPKSFLGDPKLASGQKILNIWRKAKILGIELDLSITLLFHLKMSGQLILVKNQNSKIKSQKYNSKLKSEDRFIGGHPTKDMVGELPNKSTRVVFTFSDGSKLYFNDQRRFGWIRVIEGEEGLEVLEKLGPEPLEKEFTWQILKSNLINHKSLPIKVALLDQSIVSGIGNIYASEACFNAGVDPRKKVADLTDHEFESLHRGVQQVLRDGIKYGGSTKTHFVDAEGHKGYFLDHAFVYWKDRYPCKNCGTIIEKIQLRGRGTYFCPACQK